MKTFEIMNCSLRCHIAILCATGLLVVGCSDLESQVSGKVTLDGNPIGPGIIGFQPVAGGKMATGSIKRDGNYSLKTNRKVGLAPGKYKVLVIINEGTVAEQPAGVRVAAGKSLIPEKYFATETSGLQFDVTHGENSIDVELTSQ